MSAQAVSIKQVIISAEQMSFRIGCYLSKSYVLHYPWQCLDHVAWEHRVFPQLFRAQVTRSTVDAHTVYHSFFRGQLSQQSADDTCQHIAAAADSFNYEMVCGISRRVPRMYLHNGEDAGCVHYLLDDPTT